MTKVTTTNRGLTSHAGHATTPSTRLGVVGYGAAIYIDALYNKDNINTNGDQR